MVAPTTQLNSLKKGLLPRIHQPLPLNQRESQQLLNSITSSFRKHLDQEHPWQSSSSSQEAAVPPSAPISKRLEKAVLSNKEPSFSSSSSSQQIHSKQRPTDYHLDNILSNPLFAKPQSAGPSNQQMSLHSEPLPGDVQADIQKQFYIFDSASSRGMLTTKIAAGFLASISRIIHSQSVLALEKRMRLGDTGAGLKVVQWLRSSGLDHNLEFLNDPILIKHLAPFLYAEGLEEVIWTWLSRLGARVVATPEDKETQQAITNLIPYIIKLDESKLGLTRALDDSYSAFLRMHQTLEPKNRHMERVVKNSWARLSWKSTVDAAQRPRPSVPLFEMFTDIGRPWGKQLDIAHLELHHPSSPDHASAVKYLHDDGKIASVAKQVNLAKSDRLSRRMVSLGTDTVQRLNQVGQREEASWVSELMSRTFFAWNSVLRQEERDAHANTHESSLAL
ncbi:hypothetical protein PG999_004893 [Apiospora kogelbergensis]|uniref:Uncharacterized protein n=1 Tax=Apiospora kogelbergensis TaxID=1337665 RepID=A0AAW0R0Q3_9PEZI